MSLGFTVAFYVFLVVVVFGVAGYLIDKSGSAGDSEK